MLFIISSEPGNTRGRAGAVRLTMSYPGISVTFVGMGMAGILVNCWSCTETDVSISTAEEKATDSAVGMVSVAFSVDIMLMPLRAEKVSESAALAHPAFKIGVRYAEQRKREKKIILSLYLSYIEVRQN